MLNANDTSRLKKKNWNVPQEILDIEKAFSSPSNDQKPDDSNEEPSLSEDKQARFTESQSDNNTANSGFSKSMDSPAKAEDGEPAPGDEHSDKSQKDSEYNSPTDEQKELINYKETINDRFNNPGRNEINEEYQETEPASVKNTDRVKEKLKKEIQEGKEAEINNSNTNSNSIISPEKLLPSGANHHDDSKNIAHNPSTNAQNKPINYEETTSDHFNNPDSNEINAEYQETESAPLKNSDRIKKKSKIGIQKGKESEINDSNADSINTAFSENSPTSSPKWKSHRTPLFSKATKSRECRNPMTKEALRKWYGGKCQICGKTWPKRNGEPYFVSAYLIHLKHGQWLDRPGNAICLCADHFAQWCYASKEPYNDIAKYILDQKLPQEDQNADLLIEFKLLGERVRIKYCERHFLELQAMVEDSDAITFAEKPIDESSTTNNSSQTLLKEGLGMARTFLKRRK